jgi:D-alanine-D-alanine ligase-like ATP-grasp enzyme
MPSKKFKLLILPSVVNIAQTIDRFPHPVELTEGNFKNLEFTFQGAGVTITHKGIDLREFSFVWLSSSWLSRDLAYAVKLYLKKSKTPYTYVEKGTSKITDHMLFSLNNINSPDTLFLGNKEIEKKLKLIKEVCGYPLVIKDTKGSRGAYSILVKSDRELIEKLAELPKHKKYLFQRFIPNDYDWGILVANGKVVSGEKSYPCLGEFRNNTCNGAREVFVDSKKIPTQIKKMALKANNALGLSWSRSDIIIDRNTKMPYLMEINRLPGITPKTSEAEGVFKFLSSQIECFVK